MSTRATNPTNSGSMLLDRSTAKPGSIDKAIFEKKSGSESSGQVGQGTVNPNYLRECREDNPEPAAGAGAGGAGAAPATKVTLTDCKITTPPDQLTTDKPFEMSCDVEKTGDPKNFTVFFKLFCSIVQADGTESAPKFMNTQMEGTANRADVKQTVTAKGTLVSPVPAVRRGTVLKYHVEAAHWDSATKLESPKVEVVNALLPKPVANWKLVPSSFEFDSSRIHPDTRMRMGQFKTMYDANPDTLLAVFGHADPVGDDEYNKTLSARRAKAMYSLLTRNVDMWIALSKKVGGDDWGVSAHQWMLLTVKSAAGGPYFAGPVDGKQSKAFTDATKAFQQEHDLDDDGVIGPKTKAKLYPKYMDAVCVDEAGSPFSVPADRFMGDATENAKPDGKGTGAYQGCSELNPDFVLPEPHSKDDEAINLQNRRTVVAFFKKDDFSDSDPAKPQWPCPAWSKPCKDCKSEQHLDGDARRKPGSALKSFPDTVSCMFYSGIVERNSEATTDRPDIELKTQDGSKPASSAVLSGKAAIWKAVPKNGMTGKFKWSSTSAILDLEGQDTDTLTMNTQAGKTSAAGTPEEIKLDFTPDGATSPRTFTFPLSVFQFQFRRSPNQAYGFDDMSTTAGTPGPRPHRLSVREGFPTVVQVDLEGGSASPADFEFRTFDPTIATAAPPAGAGTPFDLTVTGGAVGATELSATHTASGTACGSLEVRVYTSKTVDAILVKVEDPRADRTASQLANPGYSVNDAGIAINKSYKNAVLELKLLAPDSGVKANGAMDCEFAETDGTLIFTLGVNSDGYQKIVDLCAGLSTDTNMVFAVVVKKLLTMCYLSDEAKPGDNILKFTDNNKPSLKYFKPDRAYNLRSNTGDIEVVYVDPTKTAEGSGELWLQRSPTDTTGIVGTFPADGKHGLEFPALGWSGWPGQPIIVVEDIDEKSLSMIVGHELGHSRMSFRDVDDLQSMMNSFGRAFANQEQFQLRFIQATKSYPPAAGESPTESQWETVAR